MTEINEKNSDDLPSGFILFCANCKHSLNCHQPGRVPLCDFDEPSYYPIPEKGRYECNCKEFVSRRKDK